MNREASAGSEPAAQNRDSGERRKYRRHPRRPQHRESRRMPFGQWYGADLLLGGTLLLGIFLMFGPLAHMPPPEAAGGGTAAGGPLSGYTASAVQLLMGRLAAASDRLTATLLQTTWSVMAGLFLMLAALIAIPIRLRWRLLHLSPLRIIACPRCGGTIHRMHRTKLQRAASRLIPMRHYCCPKCGWDGIRIGSHAR